MLGDSSVGKTCIVNRYIHEKFARVEATLAQDFKSKTVKIENDGNNINVRL